MFSLARLWSRPAQPRRPRLLHLLTLARSRQRLRDLDAHMLRDIGLSADEARAEADQPVWDVPGHWRR